MEIKSVKFGELSDGTVISSYQLENDNGIIIRIINYGCIITHIFTPDNKGNLKDIVHGFDNLQDYVSPHPFFGALVGRCANRIAKGRFELNGETYNLPINNGPNHLHGGLQGFDKKVWLAVKNLTTEFAGIKFAYESPDGEEGYPGNLMVEVEYILNNQNELVINYSARTDKSTIVNLTNHSYFNFSGCEKGVLDYIVQIDSDYITEIDENLIPTGRLLPVKHTPFDFNKPKSIRKDFDLLHAGYDHNYVIPGSIGHMRRFGKAEDPISGRTLEVSGTQPGVHFYTGNFLKGREGKNGNIYSKHSAFCFETQHYPDSPNHPEFPTTVLNPGETYRHSTVFRFGNIN